MENELKISALHCAYGGKTLFRELSLYVPSGEICCLLGPSGSGKTTLLRAVAGFEAPRAGNVSLCGRALFSKTSNLPPETRKVGLVSQEDSLFPHMSAAENIEFALHHKPARERRKIAEEWLALVSLPSVSKHYPHQLSGGQRKRVMLARSLAAEPLMLALDEPFSAIDKELGKQLCEELRTILLERNIPVLWVTHDHDEAFRMAHKIAVLAEGALQQCDTPDTLRERPANQIVARCLGHEPMSHSTEPSSTSAPAADTR